MNDEQKTITRRRFVAGTLVTGATAAWPAAAEAAKRKHRQTKHKHTQKKKAHKADAVVVGAGFAGLTAARQVASAGHSVIVLEARDRVGGRAWNHDLGGGQVSERGATFVGPTQDHIMALANAVGVGTFPTYDTGDDLYINNVDNPLGLIGPMRYSDTGPLGTAPPDPTIAAELAEVVEQLDQMSTQVPVDAPWTASSASSWDGQTLQSWVDANSVTPRFQALVPAATRPIFGAEPRELSLLFVLFYIAASGNEQNAGTFERNFDTRNGAQQSRFVGGTQEIANRVAAALGDRVHLGSPVQRIVQDRAGAVVHSGRQTITAKRVIVAIPPVLAGRIQYGPALPFARDQLIQRYPQGTLTKVAAVYDTPFWRDNGLTGAVLDTGGPGGESGRVLRHQLVGRGMDPRLPGRNPVARHAARLRPPDPRTIPPDSTGPAPRPRRTGTATWMARSAPASARLKKCCPRSRTCQSLEVRGGSRCAEVGASAGLHTLDAKRSEAERCRCGR